MIKTKVFTSDYSLKPYLEVCDIALAEVSSGVYIIKKSSVPSLEEKFIDSQTVVRIMEDDNKAVLYGLQFATANFELGNDEKN